MKAAPSAQLTIKDIFGHDECIAGLWRTLDANSVRIEAERRKAVRKVASLLRWCRFAQPPEENSFHSSPP